MSYCCHGKGLTGIMRKQLVWVAAFGNHSWPWTYWDSKQSSDFHIKAGYEPQNLRTISRSPVCRPRIIVRNNFQFHVECQDSDD